MWYDLEVGDMWMNCSYSEVALVLGGFVLAVIALNLLIGYLD